MLSDLPKELHCWLVDHGAVRLREENVGDDVLIWCSVNGTVILIQAYANRDGVEVFVPTPNRWEGCLRTLCDTCQVSDPAYVFASDTDCTGDSHCRCENHCEG